ncbi:hypothetical protein IMZ48_04200 [Candidatus Bathyarchaeota archaeon]|nr:hypothetical protein [Candidatus Bathyarchaeota archaeon]
MLNRFHPNRSIDANKHEINHFHHIPRPPTTGIMEDGAGIDRKAEERMEFTTSKEVTVHPTFEAMSLKGTLQSVAHCCQTASS